MKIFNSSLSLLVAAATVISCASMQSDRNPCHPNRQPDIVGAPCEGIYFPAKMCRKCKFTEYDNEGNFNDCQAIHNIDDPECRAQIEAYSRLNTCDTVRAKQLENFDDPDNHRALDYFVYSVCEECCDCIPRGARSHQYTKRKMRGAGALTSLARGNCAAHAHYDICTVWPEIRHITKPGGTLNLKLPKVCPFLKKWLHSEQSKDWYSNDNTKTDWRIRRYLRMHNRVAQCRAKETWTHCLGHEIAQKRV